MVLSSLRINFSACLLTCPSLPTWIKKFSSYLQNKNRIELGLNFSIYMLYKLVPGLSVRAAQLILPYHKNWRNLSKTLLSCSVQWPQTGMASPWVKENWSWITRRNPTLSPCKLSTHCCCWSIVLHPLLIRWRPYCPRVCCSSELFVAVPLQSFRHPESESSADMLMKIPGKGQY